MSPDRKPSFYTPAKVARLAAVFFVGTGFGDPTPTRDALATQIAGAKQSLMTLENRQRQERELTDIRRRIEAIQTIPTVTPIPTNKPTAEPTLKPADKTATADAILLPAYAQERARVAATKEAKDVARTATARAAEPPPPRPTPRPGPEIRMAEGGINVEREIIKGEAVVLAVLIALSLMAVRTRNQLLRLIENPTRAVGRGIRWLWQHRPGAGAGPAGGAPGAGIP